MGSTPGTENLTEEEKDLAMQISLPISDGQFLIASNIVKSIEHVLHVGNNSYVSISPDSRDEATKIFNGLSEWGTIKMPLDDMF